jgi:hypothetical protein
LDILVPVELDILAVLDSLVVKAQLVDLQDQLAQLGTLVVLEQVAEQVVVILGL